MKIIESYGKYTAIFASLVILVGGLVTFKYCLNIGYYPTGISISDSIFFLSLGISFILIYAMYLLLSISAALLVVWIIRVPLNFSLRVYRKYFRSNFDLEIDALETSSHPIVLCGVMSAVIIFVLYFKRRDMFDSIGIYMCILVPILLMLLLRRELEVSIAKTPIFGALWDGERMKVKVKIGLSVFAIIFPVIGAKAFSPLCNESFKMMSISVKSADIYSEKKLVPEFRVVREKTKKDSARKFDSKKIYAMREVYILWHGVGDNMVIKSKINDKKYIIPSKGLIVSY